MADNPPISYRVNSSYDWQQPDIARVAKVIQDVILPFLGTEARFSAELISNGPPEIRQSHDSFDTWSAMLSLDWDSFSVQVNSSDWSKRANVHFYLTTNLIQVMLEMKGTDPEPLTTLTLEFQKGMSLGAPRANIGPQKQKERLEGRYHAEHPEDVTWFQKLLGIAESWLGPSRSFNGSLSRKSTAHFRHMPSQYSDWKEQCVTNWKDILDLNANINGDSREVSVRYYVNRADLGITLSSTDNKELIDLFAILEKELPILAARNLIVADSRKERRRYFASEQIDPVWLKQCVGLIRSIPKGTISFQGRFRTATPNEQDMGFNEADLSRTNYETWLREVTERWNDLVWVYCWISAPEIAITMDVDLLRDSISLDLQSPAEETFTATFNTLELGLKLIKIQGDPYQYRRFLRAFNIKRWTTNKAYADAVQGALDFVFPGRPPGRRLAIKTMFVAVDEPEEALYPYTDYSQFIKRIASEQTFTRAELVLEGPLGRALGIFVNRKTKVLTLRTSIERADLGKLSRPFENAMTLTPGESEDEPDKKKPEGDKISKAMMFTTAASMLCVLITGSVAVLTSQGGLSPLRKRYSLEITYPQIQSGMPVKLLGSDLRVEWKLTDRNITGEHSDLHSNATVSVLREGSTQPEAHPGSNGAAVVKLAPGSYFVRVVSDVDHVSGAAITVIVPDDKPAITPGDAKNLNKTQPKNHR